MKDNWWRLLLLIAVVIGLIWWRQSRNDDNKPTPNTNTEEQQVEERANRFLEERNIQLPEGAERTNLKDVSGGEGTGVVTRVASDNKTELTVLAALPDLDEGYYMAWVRNGDNSVQKLGRLQMGKGGYMVDAQVNQKLSGAEKVIISRETKATDEPTSVVLEGAFKETLEQQ